MVLLLNYGIDLEDNVYYYVPVELQLLFCIQSKSLDTQ